MDELLKKLSEKATVTLFAELIGVSKQTITLKLKKGILTRNDSLLDWLHQYTDHLESTGRTRYTGNDSLASARIAELEAKTALIRLVYNEKLESLVPTKWVQDTLINWAIHAAEEIKKGIKKLIADIESHTQTDIDKQPFTQNIYYTSKRIKDYAKKLAKGLGPDEF